MNLSLASGVIFKARVPLTISALVLDARLNIVITTLMSVLHTHAVMVYAVQSL